LLDVGAFVDADLAGDDDAHDRGEGNPQGGGAARDWSVVRGPWSVASGP
jgi:hypothetical protein